MKKRGLSVFLVMTLCFVSFTLGFFLGSGRNQGQVRLTVAASMQTDPVRPPETTSAAEADVSFPINVNTASKEELMALPGIGPTLAQRILTYRLENGPFSRAEDLQEVKGIGEKTLDKIKDLITTGG